MWVAILADRRSTRIRRRARAKSARDLHELVSFLREIGPEVGPTIKRKPFLHNAARPRLETHTDALIHELVDTSSWDLHDEFAARGHHCEDLAVHFERARAESLSRFAGHVALAD